MASLLRCGFGYNFSKETLYAIKCVEHMAAMPCLISFRWRQLLLKSYFFCGHLFGKKFWGHTRRLSEIFIKYLFISGLLDGVHTASLIYQTTV